MTHNANIPQEQNNTPYSKIDIQYLAITFLHTSHGNGKGIHPHGGTYYLAPQHLKLHNYIY